MKLISEQWSDDVNYLVEEDPKTGKKHAFIEGIMLQSNVKNKNGRIYPKEMMKKETKIFRISLLLFHSYPMILPQNLTMLMLDLQFVTWEVSGNENIKEFIRFLKIRDEFIINYFRNVLEVNEIKKIFEDLNNLNLPISDNDCLLINKVINLQHNMDFINKFYNSLKNDSNDFTVTINKNEYKVCIDEKIFKSIEKLIVEYIQIQTKDEFEKFVYEKTYN